MSGAVVNKIELLTGRRHYFGSIAAAVLLTMLLGACGQGVATPTPGTVSDDETSILEEPGNINLALREAQNGMGPSIVGDPAAVYGKIMTYTAALKAGGSNGREGESQAWKFDRLVYLYLFEGDIADGDPRTSSVTDWAQKIVIIDAETGSPFTEITHREPGRLSVSQFLPLTIRDDTKGVPPREIKSLNRPPPIPVGMATPASKPVETTPTPDLTPTQPELDGQSTGPIPQSGSTEGWIEVEALGWTSQPGFALKLPPSWELRELRGTDSYVGEIVGDGARLHFDYGSYTWILDPKDDPDHEYIVAYEMIEGVEAKFIWPKDSLGGITGVYFSNLGGPRLGITGESLTQDQQRTAFAIFRSVRSLD